MTVLEHWTPEERANQTRIEDLAERYRADPELRARIDSGDAAGALAELGIDLPEGVDHRIVADTREVRHFALPPDPNTLLRDETLAEVSGGSTLGSAASVGSMSSFVCSTGPSSLSSAGTAGTAGSRAV